MSQGAQGALATPEQVSRADEQSLYALQRYLRPEVTWQGYVGIAMLVGAAVLVWRKP